MHLTFKSCFINIDSKRFYRSKAISDRKRLSFCYNRVNKTNKCQNGFTQLFKIGKGQ